jgi:hypothetical protein
MNKYQAFNIIRDAGLKIVKESKESFEDYFDKIDDAMDYVGGQDDFHDSGIELDMLAQVCYDRGLSVEDAIKKIEKAVSHGIKSLSDAFPKIDGSDLDEYIDDDKEAYGRLLDIMQTSSVRGKGLSKIYTAITGKEAPNETAFEREKREFGVLRQKILDVFKEAGYSEADLASVGFEFENYNNRPNTEMEWGFGMPSDGYRYNDEWKAVKEWLNAAKIVANNFDEIRERKKFIDQYSETLESLDSEWLSDVDNISVLICGFDGTNYVPGGKHLSHLSNNDFFRYMLDYRLRKKGYSEEDYADWRKARRLFTKGS